MSAYPFELEELAAGQWQAGAPLSAARARLHSSRSEPDEPARTTLIIESLGQQFMLTVTDDDLGRLSELIGSFRAGIREAEGS